MVTGSHPASSFKGYLDSSKALKRQERDADHSLLLPKLIMCGSTSPFPHIPPQSAPKHLCCVSFEVFAAVQLRIPFFLKVTLRQRTTYWRSVTFQKNRILSFTLPFKRPQISSSFLYETGYNNSQKLVNLTVCSLCIYTLNGACLNTHPWHEQHVQAQPVHVGQHIDRQSKHLE
jgi:hypothetical protein